MALDKEASYEIEKSEKDPEFSGNYIENFAKKDSKDQFAGAYQSWDKVGNKYLFHNEFSSL